MSDLPAPLTPADCDLRGYDFMPLFGHRLFASEFYVRASDAGFRAGIRLWWSAWQQCPAASLPDDDLLLCRLADFGRDVKAWRAVRDEALHGFTKCSDGRLYHKLLAEEAIAAWERRRRERDRKAKLRASKSADVPPPVPPPVPRDNGDASAGQGAGQDADVPPPVRSDRTGQDRTGQDLKKEPLTPPPDGGGELNTISDESQEGPRPPGWRGQWRGLRANGSNPRHAAKAEAAAKPPPPEPSHPLWPRCRALGMSADEFARWIAPLVEVAGVDGVRVLVAPSRFHADHVRREFGAQHLAGFDIRANPEALRG